MMNVIQKFMQDQQQIPSAKVVPHIKGRGADFFILDDYGPTVSKFAPVGPCRLYTGMRMAGFIPQNILLLAHDVVANQLDYETEFAHQEWCDTNIIMDNSLIETGGAVDANMVYDAAQIVSADIVVLPDVLGMGEQSTNATLKAWPEWYWRFREYEKMVVIQGATIKGWLYSLEVLCRETEPDWVSVPRIAQTIEGYDRYELCNWVSNLFPGKPIHLLGFSDEPWKDIEAATHPSVRSIDSAVPLRMASRGLKNLLSDDPGSRIDEDGMNWWDQTMFIPEMVTNCRDIDRLIAGL